MLSQIEWMPEWRPEWPVKQAMSSASTTRCDAVRSRRARATVGHDRYNVAKPGSSYQQRTVNGNISLGGTSQALYLDRLPLI